jgi:hypothetical protein
VAGFCAKCNELLVQKSVGNFVTSLGAAIRVCASVGACVRTRMNMDEEFSVSVMIMQLICSHVCKYSVCLFMFISERETSFHNI